MVVQFINVHNVKFQMERIEVCNCTIVFFVGRRTRRVGIGDFKIG